MEHRIFDTTVASVYPLYQAKLERKGRTREELDAVTTWLTGFDDDALATRLTGGATFREFFDDARLPDEVELITGVVCGVRVETIEDPLCRRSGTSTSSSTSSPAERRSRRCCGPHP